MKSINIKINCVYQDVKSSQDIAKAHQQLRDVFRRVRQLEDDIHLQSNQVTPAAAEVNGLSTQALYLVAKVEGSANLTVLGAIKDFLERSDYSYRAILDLSNEIGRIGLQEYRKSIVATSND
ncbi:hypothetical protein ACE4RU_10740 [Actinobacillus seminis]|uniref:hypothetical protein n=1 Tax=Actinobacillus seminis TaxID=722 RepID=UPI003B9354DD